MKINFIIVTLTSVLFASVAIAHPTGNLIVVGDNVLWSYINPIDDPEHRACVMIWDKISEPKVFIQSEFSASDFMLFNNRENEIYIIEKRYIQATEDFEVRLLKTGIGGNLNVIWDWFKDDDRIGEGGFYMPSDNEIVFGKFPDILSLKKGGKPTKHFDFKFPVKRIRAVENNQALLMGDSSFYLVQQDGNIVKQWHQLIDKDVKNAPLNRNQIFDADYRRGEILLAYWGKRSFDIIDASGKRQVILHHSGAMTPHWVAFWNNEKLLFSSKLIFDGSTPKPHLVLINKQDNHEVIWYSN